MVSETIYVPCSSADRLDYSDGQRPPRYCIESDRPGGPIMRAKVIWVELTWKFKFIQSWASISGISPNTFHGLCTSHEAEG